MAGRITPELKEAILARIDIVDLISARVGLKKAGSLFKACCPFHAEKTPSFTVTPARQTYHCFGCGVHGNAIDFLIEHDRLSFPEAVEELARQAGVALPEDGGAARGGPDLGPLYQLMDQVADLYRRQLREHPQAGRAVDYLKGRGLTGEIAATFGLGYAPPGWDFLLARLGQRGPERERLLRCGLVAEQDGKRYDRFRDRIMFPIRDRRGRVIGFGGRVLGDGQPKYLNSPETPLFHKGRELYGLHEAQLASRRIDRLLVVEGYMDVIALAQHGISYAVATLGTATTADHLQRLLRVAPEVVFCFDGDRAGRAAAWKALEVALPQADGRRQMRFLFLPEGEDPDTLVRKEGRTAFEGRVQQAMALSELLFEQLSAQVDMASLDGRARLAELAKPLIEKVPAGIYRDMLAGRLGALVGLAPARVGAGPHRPAPRRPAAQGRQPLTPLRLAVAILLQHPHLGPQVLCLPDDWRGLQRQGVGLLAELLDLTAAYPEIKSAGLRERWRETDLGPHIARLCDPGLLRHIPEEGLEAELAGAIGRLNAEARAGEVDRLMVQASPGNLSEEEKERLRRAFARPREAS